MKRLNWFLDSIAETLEHPSDLDPEAFVAYDIPTSLHSHPADSLIQALTFFNDNNPLRKWRNNFSLDMSRYCEFDISESFKYTLHFINYHIRYASWASADKGKIESTTRKFLQGDWSHAYTNHGHIEERTCSYCWVREQGTHTSFIALISTNKVRILDCFEGD